MGCRRLRCKKIDGQVLNPFADVTENENGRGREIKKGKEENCDISGNFHGVIRVQSTRNGRVKHARKYDPYTPLHCLSLFFSPSLFCALLP